MQPGKDKEDGDDDDETVIYGGNDEREDDGGPSPPPSIGPCFSGRREPYYELCSRVA